MKEVGQVYKQTNEFAYIGGNVNHNECRPVHRGRPWHTQRMGQLPEVTLELHNRPSVRLELKIRMLIAEVLETMLYGCVTWSPRACHYDTMRRAHHRFLTNSIGWQNNNRIHQSILYLDTLMKTVCEITEAIMRWRLILFAGLWSAWKTQDCQCV